MILILACGNSLRSDDGAGLRLAEVLEQRWQARAVPVKRLAVHQLTPELAPELANEAVTTVVFVDTRLALPDEANPRVQIEPVTIGPTARLGHHLTPATLLAYAELLYQARVKAWQVTVPGLNFEHGESVSAVAAQALVEVDAGALLERIS